MTDLETLLRDTLGEVADLVPVSSTALADRRRRAARPGRRRRTLSLAIAGIAAATAAVVVGAVLVTNHGSSHPSAVASASSVSLNPSTPLTREQLQASAGILLGRLNALGVKDASVTVAGHGLQAELPSSAVPLLIGTIETRGVLRFRQVLAWGAGSELIPGKGASAGAHPRPESRSLARALAGYDGLDCVKRPIPTHGRDGAADYIAACDPGTTYSGLKYLLGPAALSNGDVRTATAARDSLGAWVVDVGFDRRGSTAWKRLTALSYEVDKGRPEVGTTECSPPKGCNAVAITVDGVVESAPYSEQAGGITGGATQISGSFSRFTAAALAAVLKEPPLPATFALPNRIRISATTSP